MKIFGLAIDLAMYFLMLIQMAYVFTGNDFHEWAGMGFFICLVIHLIIKRKWFSSFLRRKINIKSARSFADLMIILLLIVLFILMISSMGVSRTIFPGIHILGEPCYHHILATIGLTLAVVHGGMHGYFPAKNKKKAGIYIAIVAVGAFCIGQYGVPYIDRHFKLVNVSPEDYLSDSKCTWIDGKPIVVYFTRVGNTDFEADVDAVSGASLMIEEGKLKGNTQFMADAVVGMLECDTRSITMTEYKYPSSYSETCSVAGMEIKNQDRPAIESIDISDYDSVILIYPIWWGTIPSPLATFLEENDFTGKNVYLLATQGSSGFASSSKDIKALAPKANIIETISIYCDDIPKSREMIKECFKEKGLIME